ncbi:DUF4236 domain-containing protein [Mucilaginibacter robiniae]|uniref:DUF4236 domain-containing protein n=1 Tax=Mucilaginibacter robiniae TaxID=2728022 RepID=A0A7L5DX88_9SPHI|nr:DUF4236 domain-containing protein [Mucilaginibacter robiniae]QJD95710.1 DUF4236 domain-containing protein [Mucilaginibacter robiniae]
MGWSYRKSLGSGPFRINFSKSGISYSVGVKGARVNMGPKGTYVNLSSHGISYRRKISGVEAPPHLPSLQPQRMSSAQLYQIASADIDQLTDTDSKDFVNELTQKAGQLSYVGWLGVLPMVILIMVLLFSSFGTRTTVIRPVTDSTLAKVTSNIGVNIRQHPTAKSAIVKAATSGQTFILLDSTHSKWLQVRIDSSSGYINRRFAEVEHVHHDQETGTQTYLSNTYAVFELFGMLTFFTPLIVWLKKLDRKRFEIELHYDMDEQFQRIYQEFSGHFNTFARSVRIWQYLNKQKTNDFKRNAGAGQLISRTPIRSISGNQAPLPHFVTNVAIPCLKLSNLHFYFLPERLLVKRGNTFAAIFYRNLCIKGSTTRFIEDEGVPYDAQVVDQTWRYVNKRGGPDRRFNNNRQIPICAYSQYTLTSDTGLYEVITTSKQGAMDSFANFLRGIGNLQSQLVIR